MVNDLFYCIYCILYTIYKIGSYITKIDANSRMNLVRICSRLNIFNAACVALLQMKDEEKQIV